MGRTKDFNVDEALDRAIEVFWAKGYEAASMCDLLESMEIGRQSLYDTFGDKRQLYLKAMDRYAAKNVADIGAKLMEPKASLPELRAYFSDLTRHLAKDEERRGCLMTNAILEQGEQSAEVLSRCQNNEKRLTRVFRTILNRAVERGELSATTQPSEAATLLVGQVYALTVLAKNGASKASLERMVTHVLESL
jgi:TetR/AcrR family transcriptional repressor of nem operon